MTSQDSVSKALGLLSHQEPFAQRGGGEASCTCRTTPAQNAEYGMSCPDSTSFDTYPGPQDHPNKPGCRRDSSLSTAKRLTAAVSAAVVPPAPPFPVLTGQVSSLPSY
jgi:hypothetical protein